MKKLIILALAFCSVFIKVSADDISVYLNSEKLTLETPPVISNDRVMTPIREIAGKLGCGVSWNESARTTEIYNGILSVRMQIGNNLLSVKNSFTGHSETVEMDVAPVIINDRTCLPLRWVVEAFGGSVYWDGGLSRLFINYSLPYALTNKHTFYFQNEAEWAFPNTGSGYCWVCSYAMVLSDLTGRKVTPTEVAAVNLKNNPNGSYCYHWQIADSFGAKFVTAVDKNSVFYGGYNTSNGGTVINNPQKDDKVVINALKEAIDRNPCGVIVRFEGYPHSMTAVEYSGDTIYFNDPMRTSYEYAAKSDRELVPFSGTCLAAGYTLSDISYIQALALQ